MISRGTDRDEYGDFVAQSSIRVIKEQDFCMKDDIIRVVDYEDLHLPQYDDKPGLHQRPDVNPVLGA